MTCTGDAAKRQFECVECPGGSYYNDSCLSRVQVTRLSDSLSAWSVPGGRSVGWGSSPHPTARSDTSLSPDSRCVKSVRLGTYIGIDNLKGFISVDSVLNKKLNRKPSGQNRRSICKLAVTVSLHRFESSRPARSCM
jgi:hypothetical protein